MPQKPISILLADDDMEDSELLEEAILNIEPAATVKHVSNGKKVMDFLKNCSNPELPCLIILDYNMPEMTGAQVLTWLGSQSRYQFIPKVIFSTSGAESHVNECKGKGAIDYFVKPFNMNELETLTKKMLSLCSYN
ncbi:MAG: response regulator [Ferruginibacter sp.]